MSDLLKRFEESVKNQIIEVRKIPQLVVNFFDRDSKYQEGFTTFDTPGMPTKFTDTALDQYNAERKQVVLPSNYTPLEPDIPLNRWSPEKKYNSPGDAKK
jgi:hypothetical protein